MTRSGSSGSGSSGRGSGGWATSWLVEVLISPQLLRQAVRGGCGASGLATDDGSVILQGSGILIRATRLW